MDDVPRDKRLVYAAALLAVLAALWIGRGIWLAVQSDDGIGDDAPLEIDTRPRLTATRVVGRRQGERQFELDAGSIGDEDEWVTLEAIENGLLYRDGDVFVTFRADAGRWHRSSNNLMLEGNIELEYDGRVQIRTETLEWHAEEELVVSPVPVRLVVDGDEATAARMEADLDEERVHLEGDVHIVRASGDRVEMAVVVYWLAEERMEGFGRGRLVFDGE